MHRTVAGTRLAFPVAACKPLARVTTGKRARARCHGGYTGPPRASRAVAASWHLRRGLPVNDMPADMALGRWRSWSAGAVRHFVCLCQHLTYGGGTPALVSTVAARLAGTGRAEDRAKRWATPSRRIARLPRGGTARCHNVAGGCQWVCDSLGCGCAARADARLGTPGVRRQRSHGATGWRGAVAVRPPWPCEQLRGAGLPSHAGDGVGGRRWRWRWRKC